MLVCKAAVRAASYAVVLIVIAAALVGFLILASGGGDGEGTQARGSSREQVDRAVTELHAATAPEGSNQPEERSAVATEDEPPRRARATGACARTRRSPGSSCGSSNLRASPCPVIHSSLSGAGRRSAEALRRSTDSRRTDADGYLRLEVKPFFWTGYARHELIVTGGADGADAMRGFHVPLDEVLRLGAH